MAALTDDRKTEYFEGKELAYPVAGSTTIYAGSLVCLNSSGYAVPAADVAGYTFVGVAMENVDNSSGSDGDENVTVRRKGVFRFDASGMAITDVGADVYASDDHTVAKSTTNSIKVGTIAEFVSATEIGIDIDK